MEGTRKTAIRRRKRTKAGRYVDELTREELASHFGLPAQQAAAAVGVSFTIFKRICRNFGLERWPYRRLKALGLAGEAAAAAPTHSQPALHAGALLPMPALSQQQPAFPPASGASGYPDAAATGPMNGAAEATAREAAAGPAAVPPVPAPAPAASAGMPDMLTLASSDMRASGLSCGTYATNFGSRPLPPVRAGSLPLPVDAARCSSVRSGLSCLADVAMDAQTEPDPTPAEANAAGSSLRQQEHEPSRPSSPWQAELALQAQRAKQSHDAAMQQQQQQQQQEEADDPHSIRVLLCAATAAAHAGREPELQALLRMLLSQVDRRLQHPEDALQRDALLRLREAAQVRLGRAASPACGGTAAVAGSNAQSPRQSTAQQHSQQAKPARSEEEGFGFELSLALPVPLMAQQQAQQQAQRPPPQAELQLEFPQPQQQAPQLEFPQLPPLRMPLAAALIQAATHLPQLQAAAAAAAAAGCEPVALMHAPPWPPAQRSSPGLVQQLLQPQPLTPAESHGSVINRIGPAAICEDHSPHTADSGAVNRAFGAFVPVLAAPQQHRAAPIRPRPVPAQAFPALAELVAAAHPMGAAVPHRLANARVEVQRLRAASASPAPSACAL